MRDRSRGTGGVFRGDPDEIGALESYRTLVNAIGDGLYQLDAAGRFVAANDAIVEMTGYAREDLLDEHVSIVVDERDVERLDREIRTRLETGVDSDTTFDLVVRTADGDRVPCELRFSLLVAEGSFEGTVGVAQRVDDHGREHNKLTSIWETYESISSVIDEADVSVFVLDEEFDVAWIDETTEEYFGVDRTDIVGRDKRTVIEETVRNRLAKPEAFTETVFATYDDNTYIERFECQITPGADRDGRWLEHRSKPIESGRYAGGRVELYYDITDRKELEHARREREQQLQRERDLIERILETSPVGIAVVNPDGSTSRANERMSELLGVPPEGASKYAAGQRDMFDENGDLLPVEERPAGRVFETGEPLYDQEIRLDLPDGQQRWLSINATPISNERGEPEQVVATATDVTDLKEQAERRKRELEEREKELAAVQLATNLLETGDQPIEDLLREFVTKIPQFFWHPERTAARISIGQHETTTDGYEPLDRKISTHTSTDNGTPITIDIVLLELPSENDAEPFFDEEQELIDTLATIVKFHFERREYVDELRAETRRLEQFAYAASHDLKEPLRMVSSYLQLIERRYEDVLDEDGEEFLEFAIDGAERMREMIDGLLAYSRVETKGNPFEPLDLNTVLEDVLSDLTVRVGESGAEITEEPLPRVEGDASQLRQVFQNLLVNAIEYSDGVPRIRVSAERERTEWVISIRDEGIGIEPGATDRIFDVFQRLHAPDERAGTGIGLALCERIVERHNGEIWVESEPGEGSTFSFTLPAARDHDA